MMKKYIVIYMDQGDTCDGLARVLKTHDTFTEANKEMNFDIAYYLSINKNAKVVDRSNDYCIIENNNGGCQWQILTINLKEGKENG